MATIILLFLSLNSAQAQNEPRHQEFVKTFLSSNYNAYRFGKIRPYRAGSLLNVRTFSIEDQLSNCLEGDHWRQVYHRGPIGYSTSLTNSLRSGRVDVDAAFGLNFTGSVDFSLRELIARSAQIPFAAETDYADISANRASEWISDSPSCEIFIDALQYNYLPNEYILIEQVIFLSGEISHEYEFSIEGEAGIDARIPNLANFMQRVPVLEAISDYFRGHINVQIGGALKEGQITILNMGDPSDFPEGYIPYFVNEPYADEVLSFFDEDAQIAELLEATKSTNAALTYLEQNPQFDFLNEESLLFYVFSGDGLSLYRHFSEKRETAATRLAIIFSSLLEVNELARQAT